MANQVTEAALDARLLSEEALIASFEALELDPETFAPHEQHVRLAFAYLSRVSLIETLERYDAGLRRLANHAGAPRKYHATVTWAMIVLIHDRVESMSASDGEPLTWVRFAARNPDVLRFRDGALFDLYPLAMLDSERARRRFVLPGMPL